MRWSLSLAGNDDGNIHDDKLVARVELGRPLVGDEGGGGVAVVHVGDVPVGRELDQLGPGTDSLPRIAKDAQLHQGRAIPPPSITDKHFGSTETAVIEVRRKTRGRVLEQLIVVRDILSETGEDDGEVGDGVLVVARLQVHLQAPLLQLLLLIRRRKSANDEIVRHTSVSHFLVFSPCSR